jgi:hypothetical protein
MAMAREVRTWTLTLSHVFDVSGNAIILEVAVFLI